MFNISYFDALTRYYPEIQAEAHQNGSTYADIVWREGGPIPQNELEIKILDLAKEQRIAEISQDCENYIMSGFQSAALGSPHIYDSEFVDQINLVGALIMTSPFGDDVDGYSIYYACRDVATGIKNYYVHTYPILRQIIYDGSMFKLENLQKFHFKRLMVTECETLAEIDAITWDSPWF